MFLPRWPAAFLRVVLAALLFAGGGCSGVTHGALPAMPLAEPAAGVDSSSAATVGAVTVVPAASATAIPTATLSGTVVLPAGSRISLRSLQVRNSLGSAPAGATGTFRLTAFAGGPQLTSVIDAAGNPILMGWLVPGRATKLDAASTAAALLYFATNTYVLPSDVRGDAIALIPATPGLVAVTNAVSSALVASTNPFGKGSPRVSAALESLVASLARAHANAPPPPRPSDVLINPLTSGSGLTLHNDFPDGVHFTNAYRRRADAYVERESYVDAGGTTVNDPKALLAEPAQIPPVTGTNNGVFGSFGDIFNGNYAFSEVSTPEIELPPVAGARKTTFLVTVVGPGAHPGVFDSLSGAQRADLSLVKGRYFVFDLLLPLLCSTVVPANSSAIDKLLESEGAGGAAQDLLTAIMNSKQIYDAESAGRYGSGLAIAAKTVLTSNAMLGLLQKVIADAVKTEGGAVPEAGSGELLQKWNAVLLGTNIGLAAFDTTVVGSEFANSNEADRWQVDVIPDTVTLLPSNSKVAHARSEKLTANVPADTSSDHVPLQYAWRNTARFGHITDPISGDKDRFTTSSKTVTYAADDQGLGSDTVTVAVATKSAAGSPSVPVGTERSAAVTVVKNKDPLVRISPPGCVQFGADGGTQTYTLTPIDAPKDLTLLYGWTALPLYKKFMTFDVPGATENPFLQQLVGTSPKATLTVDKLPFSVGGFNGDVAGYLYYRGADGQPKSFDGEVISSYAMFGVGQINCKGGSTGSSGR